MARHQYITTALAIAILAIALAGCNLMAEALPTQDANAVYTQAAQTVVARLTQDATGAGAEHTRIAQTIVAELTRTVPTATNTLPPATSTPTNTQPPPPPTWTPQPPTETPNPLPCDAAAFITDLTVPDGSVFPSGAQFEKVWRIRNVGTCTWDNSYSLVFVSGDRMGAERVLSLGVRVFPGDTVDLDVDMIAPDQSGTYRSNWMLRNARGDLFGIGRNNDTPFFVQIRVARVNPDFDYDFVANLCEADWSSRANSDLRCPGRDGDAQGYALILDRPPLENGRIENEPAILAVPDDADNGYIRGVYRNIRIREGNRFLSGIGCMDDSRRCDVIFTLSYRSSTGQVVELGSWREVYDGEMKIIDIDLTFLAGQTVDFYLEVDANGRNRDDTAVWWVPHIRK